jgi:phage baseplate assembly protein W
MAQKINDITATNWQLSLKAPGAVAEGIDDIRQCVQTILTTTQGSDPLRPLFGSIIWKYIDTPVTSAVSNISAEIIDCIGKWEPRVIVQKLVYNITGSKIEYAMTMTLLEFGEVTELLFFIDRKQQIENPSMGHAFSNGFDFGFY